MFAPVSKIARVLCQFLVQQPWPWRAGSRRRDVPVRGHVGGHVRGHVRPGLGRVSALAESALGASVEEEASVPDPSRASQLVAAVAA